ncbi:MULTISPECIES: hypothetical protein [Mesorhizobium]|jgi:hypothetical protein|nr:MULTISPECIES: hypothetical protein [Mesorhizobium]MDQ0331960.1 hypothetical protein [Mesorhizobium sp. YL-MeA3-2017]
MNEIGESRVKWRLAIKGDCELVGARYGRQMPVKGGICRGGLIDP